MGENLAREWDTPIDRSSNKLQTLTIKLRPGRKSLQPPTTELGAIVPPSAKLKPGRERRSLLGW